MTNYPTFLREDAAACRTGKMVSDLLVILNNCVNPIVYFIFTKQKRLKRPKTILSRNTETYAISFKSYKSRKLNKS